MKLLFSLEFEKSITDILNYIEKDNKKASYDFENELFKKLEDLSIFPYKFRKSIYYNDEDVRDFIFKGYTIPYLIDKKREVIVILDIFKWVNR